MSITINQIRTMATMTVQYATPKLMLSHAPRRVTYCVCDTCTPLVAIVLDRFNWFKRTEQNYRTSQLERHDFSEDDEISGFQKQNYIKS